jgi:hypothetical protein
VLVVGLIAPMMACSHDNGAPTEPPPSLVVPPYAGTLLAADHIALLPADQRTAWTAYVSRSELAMGNDQLLVRTELAANHLSSVIRPLNTPNDFVPQGSWTSTWAATSTGRALVATVLSYQTASGEWGKHIDYSQGARKSGMGYNSEGDDWAYVGTNRAIFSNRDCILPYDYNLLTDRRTGYAWYGTEPSNTLRAYDAWTKLHPMP